MFYFPFYFKEFERSTRDFSDEEVGSYLRLLIHQFDKGSLPASRARLRRISESVDKHEETVLQKFEANCDGGLINRRMKEIREAALAFSRTQSEKGKKGGNPNFAKGKSNPYYQKTDKPEVIEKISAGNLGGGLLPEVFFVENKAVSNNNKPEVIQKDNPKDIEKISHSKLNNIHTITKKDITKKKKSEKKIFSPPTLEEWTAFFSENGYSSALAGRAWKGYDAANWNDSRGKPIRNWKQKAIHVWFKEENRADGPSKNFDKKEFNLPTK